MPSTIDSSDTGIGGGGGGARADAPGDPGQPGGAGTTHVRVAIIGTGFAGIGMAIKLLEAGERDLVLLERADQVGGTWRDNSYPGCQCDVPSHLYSFSFAPNPRWSRSFAPQQEIQDYLVRCATDFGVLPHCRFGHEVIDARWDDAAQQWHITTSQASFTADILISGHGPLSEPAYPTIAGLERFQGTTFHSATWDHDHDLAGERVAVIGTGASAIQFVPAIQPTVGHLDLFQRTPPWIVPRVDRAISRRTQHLLERFPSLQRIARGSIYWTRELLIVAMAKRTSLMRFPEKVAHEHLESQVPDPGLRAKLTPTYAIGCKRILLSNDYYPALSQPNVDVVTEGITEVREHSIITAGGSEREVDTIIYGTGFRVTDHPIAQRLRGADGRSLAEHWAASLGAYLGSTVAGFPNFFMIVGPNTGLGHTSMVVMMEAQFAYILDALDTMARRGVTSIDVRPQVQQAYSNEMQTALADTVWGSGCASWYLDKEGRNTTLWPTFTFSFKKRTSHFDPASYTMLTRRSQTVRT